jgi:predicted transcriptional regulator
MEDEPLKLLSGSNEQLDAILRAALNWHKDMINNYVITQQGNTWVHNENNIRERKDLTLYLMLNEHSYMQSEDMDLCVEYLVKEGFIKELQKLNVTKYKITFIGKKFIEEGGFTEKEKIKDLQTRNLETDLERRSKNESRLVLGTIGAAVIAFFLLTLESVKFVRSLEADPLPAVLWVGIIIIGIFVYKGIKKLP